MRYLESLDGEYETIVAAAAYAITTTLEEQQAALKQKRTTEKLDTAESRLDEKAIDSVSDNRPTKQVSGEEPKEEENQWLHHIKTEAKERQTGDVEPCESKEVEKAAKQNYSNRNTDVDEEFDGSPIVRKMPPFTKKHSIDKHTKRIESKKENTVEKKAPSTKAPAGFSPGYKNWDKNSNIIGKFEKEADAWEKVKMINAHNRYDKMLSVISEWQSEKKAKAKSQMERKQGGPEEKRVKALQHYNKEISKINKIVGDARALAKERKQNEEMKIKEKAAKIRSTGRVPNTCCTCC